LCGAFHAGPAKGVYFGHYGAKPEAWGRLMPSARAILNAFAQDQAAAAIVGWTDTKNRAALAFNKRIGFESRGEIAPGITEQVWRPKWL